VLRHFKRALSKEKGVNNNNEELYAILQFHKPCLFSPSSFWKAREEIWLLHDVERNHDHL
jgi:hypothetical protein